MGTFDPANFLDATFTDSNATSSTPPDEGDYTGIVEGEPAIRQWTSRDGTKSGLALDVMWGIDLPQDQKDKTGRDHITVKQGIMLDLNDNGGLDMGKGRNISLGRLREAVGLNSPGQPFNFRMLSGKMAKINIKHRIDGDAVYADVKGVARLA
jgi:hypothetical protein